MSKVPLAQKLIDSGCFGASGYEYLKNATENRTRWQLEGQQISEQMIAEFEKKIENRRLVLKRPSSSSKLAALMGDTESESSSSADDAEEQTKGVQRSGKGMRLERRKA